MALSSDAEEQQFFDDGGESSGFHAESFQQSDAIVSALTHEEWDYASEEVFCGEQDELVAIAAVDSRPVDSGNLAVQGDEYLIDFFDLYDDPDPPDFEWSGPIQPNAPPIPLLQQEWDWEEAPDDELPPEELPQTAAPAGQVFEDPWDYQEVAEPSQLGESYQQSDTIQPRADDPVWDFDADQVDEDQWPDDYLHGAAAARAAYEDDWSWDEVEDEPQVEDIQIASVVPSTSTPPDDPWDYNAFDIAYGDLVADSYQTSDGAAIGGSGQLPEEPVHVTFDDDGDEDFFDDFGNFDRDVPFLDDAWDWDSEQLLDEYQPDNQVLPASVVPGAPLGPDDAWEWTEEATDDVEGESPVGAGAIAAAGVVEDGWPWWEEDATDELEVDQAQQPVVSGPPILDDAWDWDDAGEEVLPQDDYALVTAIPNPLRYNDDPWDWDEWSYEDPEQFFEFALAAFGYLVNPCYTVTLLGRTFTVYLRQRSFTVALPARPFTVKWRC